jgi:hypothetical protein
MRPGVYLACEGETSNVVVTTCNSHSLTSTANPTLGTVEFATCPVTGTTLLQRALDLGANPVFVKYRPSDLPLLQRAVPTWGSFPGVTIPPTAQPSSSASGGGGSPSGASSSSGGPSGLSQDAKIAIGVAVPVAVIAFLLGGVLAMRWRKAQRSKEAPAPSGPEHLKPELDGQGKSTPAPKHGGLERAESRTELATERRPQTGTPGYPAEMGEPRQHAGATELAA